GAGDRLLALEPVEDREIDAEAQVPARAPAGQRRVVVEPVVSARGRDRWEILTPRGAQRRVRGRHVRLGRLHRRRLPEHQLAELLTAERERLRLERLILTSSHGALDTDQAAEGEGRRVPLVLRLEEL